MTNFPQPALLAITHRGQIIENLHYGWICILNKDKKIVFHKGNIRDIAYLRSTAKPIQAIPIIDSKVSVTLKELAIICGSHTGSAKHLTVLNNFIRKNKLLLSDLQCGVHAPSDEPEKNNLIKRGLKPSLLHNNCSGKHLGMIAVCKKNNWSTKSYLSINHPLQKEILKKIKELSETKDVSIAIDGCGAPTFALSIINIAKLFSNLTNKTNNQYIKIVSAMTQNPFLTGGKNQIDSEIMHASNSTILTKVGAEGIIIASKNGESIVVKIADGSPRIRSVVILNILKEFKWLNKSEIKNTTIKEFLKGTIKNHTGKIVGDTSVIL